MSTRPAEPMSTGLLASMLTVICHDAKHLTDAQRRRIISVLASEFCIYCGSLKLPCYCTRDD